ncbi:MAG: ATP-binding protein, partial [Muribaculaceae bacterium]|nr:ATP-binding protein [Muribaculaceae bacterium]
HVMAAGSLLGVALSHKESFPVGKVDMLRIYPMDFEEFLLGIGQKYLSDVVATHDQSLIAVLAEKLTDYLFQYYFVGGMPEVVSSFALHNDLNQVRDIQREIIEAYRRDTVKHTSKTESVRINQVLESLPSQLAKENRRFVYGAVRKGGRAADFEIAIQWLQDAGLLYKASRVSKIAVPLKFYEEFTSFKLFFVDTGLLGCMAEVPPSIIVDRGDNLTEFKGMLTEQYVAQQLASAGFSLYYWTNNSTPAEIDFAIQKEGKAYPIEVKASRNVRGKSIAQYINNNPGLTGLRFSLLDFKEQDWITNIPLYEIPYRF